jgi:hypothetical protein
MRRILVSGCGKFEEVLLWASLDAEDKLLLFTYAALTVF